MAGNTVNNKAQSSRDFSQVQVINRAAAILRALRESGSLNLSELARKVGLARSTVFRIVATLEAENLVTYSGPGGQIQLGTELVSLGAAVRSDMRHELRPFLEELSNRIDETINLAILEDDHIVFLDQVNRPQRLLAVSEVGMKFPLHSNSTGKILIAYLSEEDLERIVPVQLEEYTPNTLKTRNELMLELQEIRASGIAYDREEHTLGICALSVLINGPMNSTAALSMPLPSVRFYGYEKILTKELLKSREMINSRFATR
jgi:DNA-binding IclR family transcriptional regulator